MNKAVTLPLVAAISGALLGCGGSSGGPSDPGYTPKNVTWKFVEPYQVAEADLGNCSIYHHHIAQDENEEDYFVAARIATTGYKVLFHNEDGSIDHDMTIIGSSNGSITFDWKKIPDNGYVSIEENSGLNAGNRETYITSFATDLVTDMTLSVRSFQDGNSCITNETYTRLNFNENAHARFSSAGLLEYFQTSGSKNEVTGGSRSQGEIPVYAELPAKERKLATSFSDYDSSTSKYNGFVSYAIFDKANIYDASDSNVVPTPVLMDDTKHETFDFFVDDNISFEQGSVDVVLDNKIYSWQEIFAQDNGVTNSAFVETDTNLKNWSLSATGVGSDSIGNWSLGLILPLSGQDVHFEQPNYLSDFVSSSVNESCIVGELCVDAYGFYSEDWDVQRTHVRALTNTGKSAFQTIYAYPNEDQPLMLSSTETLTSNTSDKILVTLVKTEDLALTDVAQFVASNSYDIDTLSDKDINPNTHQYDVNGVVFGETSKVNLQQSIMEGRYEFAQNSVNW
ncbi:hypothetical protein RCJ22_27110 [Vibrio sp. FNV 38]|nr:hypothetical protein [Vibrio sp. FNV 38]